jgi:hypothetical protein
MSSGRLLQPMFGLTLVVLWLAGCGRATAGPTFTPTPIPATVTPAEVLVTEQPVDDTSQEETDQLTVKASSPLRTATTYSQPKTSPKISLEVVEQFAGDILSVATAGELVYMGLGTRVVMVDVSDPDRSKIINQYFSC